MKSKFNLAEILPFLIPFLAVLGAVLSIVFLALPWIKQGLDANSKIASGKSYVENTIKPKIKILAEQDAKILDENFKLAIQALPQDANSLFLMNTLEKFAKAYGVDLSGISYIVSATGASTATTAATTGIGGTAESTFSLSTTSDYATIIAMISGYENLLPLNSISNLKFNKGQEGSSEISFSFSTSFYSQPSQTQGVAEMTNVAGLTTSDTETLAKIQAMKDYPLIPLYKDAGKDNLFR